MKLVELGQYCQVKNGYAFKSNDFSQEGIPIIRISDINNEVVSTEDSARILRDEKFNKYIVPHGSVLIAMSGATTGKIGIYKESHLAYQNQRVGRFVTDENFLNNDYLYFILKSKQSWILKAAFGGGQPNISSKALEKIKIPLPIIDDQKRITHLLGKVEGLIARRKQHLQQLDDLLKSVFLEMFGIQDGTYKRWTINKLVSRAEIVSGVTKGKKYKNEELIETPYMRVANVQDGYFDLKEIKTIAVTKKEINRYLLKHGDLLLTEGGDPDKLGRGSVWEEQIANCIHQNHIFRVRVDAHNEIIPYFLSALVGSVYGKAYFLKSAKQTTGIASINSTQLKNFPLVIPPVDLQKQFAAIAKKVEGIKTRYQQSLADLETLYGALSQKAFKGELDLSRVPLPSIPGELTVDLPNIELEMHGKVETVAYELPDPGNLKILASSKGRRKLLKQWLDAYLGQLGATPFSAQHFMEAAQQKLSDLVEDETPEWGAAEYDQIKDWIFKGLGSGRLKQSYDAEGNQVQITSDKS